jgi:beta-hydroxyacyl-ACP dehydratase FabZ
MAGDGGFDIREIQRRLPHRQPLLLVDRVLEVKPGSRLLGLKNVTVNEDYFRGHFPGNPIMPGVLVIEAMAQAAGLLISASIDRPERLLPYLVGVDEVRFRRPVLPGDGLRLEVDVLRSGRRYWRFAGRAWVGDERAAEAQILLAVLERPEEGA